MKLFNFGSDDAGTVRMDEHATNPGAQSVPSGGGSVAGTLAGDARKDAIAQAEQSPRRRRRASADAGNGGVSEAALSAQINARIAAQLQSLHSPKAWAALLALPAAGARAFTGEEHWKLDAEERETLGETGSACAQTLMITNPRALALMMASAALLSVYGPRLIKQLEIMRERKEKGKDAKAPGATG